MNYERLSVSGLKRGTDEYRKVDAENKRRYAAAQRAMKDNSPRCNLCGNKQRFENLSALRKHQWKAHKEHYARVGRKHRRQHKSLVKLEPSPNGRSPLLARELLAQLQSQQKFMNDVVSLISGIISQHEENK